MHKADEVSFRLFRHKQNPPNKTAAELKKAEQEEEQKAIEAEKEVKEEEKHEK